MKNIKILTVLICFAYFGLQHSYGQSEDKKTEVVYKIQKTEVPESVNETLKNYSGYKISEKVTYSLSKKNGVEKVYTFKIERKNYPYYLLVNEKGKVLGIKSEEGNQK